MARNLSIYLVRHGESEANRDKTINMHKADHLIELSPAGRVQAAEAGSKLAHILGDALDTGETVAVYVSPYTRARQTWTSMHQGMTQVRPALPRLRVRESIFLRELEFGLFDGVDDDDLPRLLPLEYRHYAKLKSAGGEYYARMPCGESRCDVAQRVHQGFGSIHRDHERHDVRHAIIVSHGVTVRAFAMMWLGLTPEWMEAERNPLNGSIRLISAGRDHGYVHNGHPGHNPARDRREDGRIEAGDT
jgi:broad specificity phosphatase PhoE